MRDIQITVSSFTVYSIPFSTTSMSTSSAVSTPSVMVSTDTLRAFKTTKHSPIDIYFKDLIYSIQVEDQSEPSWLWSKSYVPKNLLKGISGLFRAGQVSTIMGSSGAGKTTLLNALACRVPRQNLTGQIYANGLAYSGEELGEFANYVMQEDILMHTLTVRETLEFAAGLKLGGSSQEQSVVIKNLASALKLQSCMETLVGSYAIKGISGGEKKRVSIAFELISDPQVIMLDEPTSGLDSLTAFIIVRHLKRLAQQDHKTVIMTIHQPNSQIFALFDRLMLMSEGKIVYQGPSAEAVSYFESNFALKCPEISSPAEFLISTVYQKENLELYSQVYDQRIAPKVTEELTNLRRTPIEARHSAVPFIVVLCTLLKRGVTNVFRNRLLFFSRLIQAIFLGLFSGGLYAQFSGQYTSRDNWRALTGFAFLYGVGIFYIEVTPVSVVFPLQRPVFLKEEGSKMYSTATYFLSRCIIDFPLILFFPLVILSVVYWLAGLSSTATQFFTCYLTCVLLALAGNAVGLLVGSIVEDARSARSVINLFVAPMFLFAGMFKNRSNLPVWIGWVEYLSPVKYGFSAILQNQVRFASESNIGQLNFELSIGESLGILAVVGLVYRLIGLVLLHCLRTKLE